MRIRSTLSAAKLRRLSRSRLPASRTRFSTESTLCALRTALHSGLRSASKRRPRISQRARLTLSSSSEMVVQSRATSPCCVSAALRSSWILLCAARTSLRTSRTRSSTASGAFSLRALSSVRSQVSLSSASSATRASSASARTFVAICQPSISSRYAPSVRSRSSRRSRPARVAIASSTAATPLSRSSLRFASASAIALLRASGAVSTSIARSRWIAASARAAMSGSAIAAGVVGGGSGIGAGCGSGAIVSGGFDSPLGGASNCAPERGASTSHAAASRSAATSGEPGPLSGASIEAHDGADRLARVHQVEGVVDLARAAGGA